MSIGNGTLNSTPNMLLEEHGNLRLDALEDALDVLDLVRFALSVHRVMHEPSDR